jgi:CheY-like chemotaxis protein
LKDRGVVLVVDDEPLVRNMAQTMLTRKLGYDVLMAGDGHEAEEIGSSRISVKEIWWGSPLPQGEG